jgi:hypothetical protein
MPSSTSNQAMQSVRKLYPTKNPGICLVPAGRRAMGRLWAIRHRGCDRRQACSIGVLGPAKNCVEADTIKCVNRPIGWRIMAVNGWHPGRLAMTGKQNNGETIDQKGMENRNRLRGSVADNVGHGPR